MRKQTIGSQNTTRTKQKILARGRPIQLTRAYLDTLASRTRKTSTKNSPTSKYHITASTFMESPIVKVCGWLESQPQHVNRVYRPCKEDRHQNSYRLCWTPSLDSGVFVQEKFRSQERKQAAQPENQIPREFAHQRLVLKLAIQRATASRSSFSCSRFCSAVITHAP